MLRMIVYVRLDVRWIFEKSTILGSLDKNLGLDFEKLINHADQDLIHKSTSIPSLINCVLKVRYMTAALLHKSNAPR